MIMKLNNLTYATISIDDLAKVQFEQVSQTSADTLKRSLDLTQFILSWSRTPSFIEDESIVPIGVYTHSEIRELILTDEWLPNEE